MNKILSLLFAGCFFLSILLFIASALWYSSVPAPNPAVLSQQDESSSITGQSDYSFDSLQTAKPGYILIYQINSPEGKPVEGASVELKSLNRNSYRCEAISGASGQARILLLEKGSYRVTANADNYSPTTDQITIVDSSDHEQTRILTLGSPLYKVKGRVASHTGVAVKGATVAIELASDSRISEVTLTQRNGGFTFENLHPGDYLISTAQDGMLGIRRPVTLHSDRPAILWVDSTARVNGLVLDEGKRPVAGATVTIACPSESKSAIGASLTQENGRFTFFNLPAKTYNVQIQADGYSSAQYTFDVTESVHSLELPLKTESVAFQGQVINLTTRQGIPGVCMELVDRPVSEIVPRKIQEIKTGENGAFTLTGLLPGRYQLRLAEAEQSRLCPAAIDLCLPLPNKESALIKLKTYASVSGQIADETGAPVPNASVTMLFPAAKTQLARAQSVLSDQQGRYVFPHLASSQSLPESGRYSARLVVSHPNFAVGFSEPFQYAPGEKIDNINLVLNQGFSVKGQTLSNLYRSIGRAVVFAHIFNGPGGRLETESDADGKYRIDRIPSHIPKEASPGASMILGVLAAGYESQSRDLNGGEGELLNINFVLRNAEKLSGTVLLPNGSPAVGARLLMLDQSRQTAETNAAGRFQFRSVDETTTVQVLAQYGPSRYQSPENLRIHRDSIAQSAYAGYGIPEKLDGGNVVMVLQPENGIVGQALDGEHLTPLSGFKATLEYRFPLSDQYTLWSEREGTWNEPIPGEFRFSAPLPGEYRLTLEAEGFLPAQYQIQFFDPPQVRRVDARLTRAGKGSVSGFVHPYQLFGSIERLQIVGQGIDRQVNIAADPTYANPGIGRFLVDNLPPGAYELFAVFSAAGDKPRQSLTQFTIAADQALELDALDISGVSIQK